MEGLLKSFELISPINLSACLINGFFIELNLKFMVKVFNFVQKSRLSGQFHNINKSLDAILARTIGDKQQQTSAQSQIAHKI